MSTKSLKEYLDLVYPYELTPEHDGFFARHPDLPGCMSEGDTPEEAMRNLDEAREAWIETRLENGFPVPEPRTGDFSGKISLRMPSGLHERLSELATKEGVSLNLLLNKILAEYMGGVARESAIERRLDKLTNLVRESAPGRRLLSEPQMTVGTETKAPLTFWSQEPRLGLSPDRVQA